MDMYREIQIGEKQARDQGHIFKLWAPQVYFRKSTGSLGWLQKHPLFNRNAGTLFLFRDGEITVREGRRTEQAYERKRAGEKEELRTWKQSLLGKGENTTPGGGSPEGGPMQACQA